MKRTPANTLRLSASDLANHLGCRHLTTLDLDVAHDRLKPPPQNRVMLEALQQRGFQHEADYLAQLRANGLTVADLASSEQDSPFAAPTPAEATLQAMRTGVGVIAQATLDGGTWHGRADILLRVERPSALGPWGYEVVDTKLARETRAGTILQLCLYSELVGELQGFQPEYMHVVSPASAAAAPDSEASASGLASGSPLQPSATPLLEPESFRVDDYRAYYRLMRARLLEAVGGGGDGAGVTEGSGANVVSASPGANVVAMPATYPEPAPQCDICRWWSTCEQRRRADDHLSLVAGISGLQRKELGGWGVGTLESLAKLPLPLERKPSRGSIDSLVRVREQARVQLEGRVEEAPRFELLDREPERGLARLPAPSAGDLFFDIEGDPFVGTCGLEYLLGWVELGPRADSDSKRESPEPAYHALWATNAAEERLAFEAFIDDVMARRERHPDLHIFHFAPYEPGAIKRLMGRYATREEEVDRLLRGGVFVDLYAVVRQSLRASVERYSIKDLERFYGFVRGVELREASRNLRAFERALELRQVHGVPDDVRAAVEGYNRDDCLSTLHLRDWLEGLRDGLVQGGEAVPRPEPREDDPSAEVGERQQRVLELRARLLEGVPDEREERSETQQALWLLAHLLDFHRREAKVGAWERFRLLELDAEELFDERAGVSGLSFVGVAPSEAGGGSKKSRNEVPVHRYAFPAQETDLSVGDDLFMAAGPRGFEAHDANVADGPDGVSEGGPHREGKLDDDGPAAVKVGRVEAIDTRTRTVDIKKTKKTANLHPDALFKHKSVGTQALEDSLLRLGEHVAEHGLEGEGPHRAARALLLALPPRVRGDASTTVEPGASLLRPDERTLDGARRLALSLDGGLLALQGPPGAGKTYTGARMILSLVRAGKRVGVSAGSHKVIRNLLDGVVKAAAEEGVDVRCLQKVPSKSSKDKGSAAGDDPAIREATDNKKLDAILTSGEVDVIGGTAWLWAREELHEKVDVLFVDEAGQLALANALAVAQAARSLVLLGDPQQLEQPLQGSHPPGTAVSALEHLLGAHPTLPPDRGLFLPETFRLHPAICAMTSELFYEGRLSSRPGLERQSLDGPTPFAGAGLWFVPVQHAGNQNSAPEEVERVVALYRGLVTDGIGWTDHKGVSERLTEDDILIVAPYNAHVGALGERLPNARIGTVDKFQGQEAPVVIYSMATSSPEEAPRGMEFLFSLNRLNVATSRARCVCILVASPRLFEPECRTPRQMRLANAFCRYVELARTQ